MSARTGPTGWLNWFRDPVPETAVPSARLQVWPSWTGGLAVVDPGLVSLDAHLLNTFPPGWLQRHGALPLAQDDQHLVLGLLDPCQPGVTDALRKVTSKQPLIVQLARGGGTLPEIPSLRMALGPPARPEVELLSSNIQAWVTGPLARVRYQQTFKVTGAQRLGYFFPLLDGSLIRKVTARLAGVALSTKLEFSEEGLELQLDVEGPTARGELDIRLEYVQEVPCNELAYLRNEPRGNASGQWAGFELRIPCPEVHPIAPLALEVSLHLPGLCLDSLSASQPALWRGQSGDRVTIQLDAGRPRLHRDFLLRYRGAPSGRGQIFSDGRHFLVHLPARYSAQSAPRDLYVLMEQSAQTSESVRSRWGCLLQEIVARLGPEDRFCLGGFAEEVEVWPHRLQSAELSGKLRAAFLEGWMNQAEPKQGRRDFRSALTWALQRQAPAEREICVLIFWDGPIPGWQRLLQVAANYRGRVRLFTLTRSPGSETQGLNRLCRSLGGASFSFQDSDCLKTTARRLLTQMGAPVLSQLQMVGQGFHADPESLSPRRFPNLLQGQTLRAYGQHDSMGPVLLLANQGEEASTFQLLIQPTQHPALPLLWAMAYRRQLLEDYEQAPPRAQADIRQRILRLEQEYALQPSIFTSVQRWLEEILVVGRVTQGQEDREEAVRRAVARLSQWLVNRAAVEGASHIHIEVHEQLLRIRFRISGRLQLAAAPAFSFHQPLLAHLRSWAGLPEVEGQFQQAQLSHHVNGRELKLELSLCPTIEGYKAVIALKTPRCGTSH